MLRSNTATHSVASRAMRICLPLASATLCLWLLSTSIKLPSMAELTEMMSHIPAFNWFGAAIATVISFWSLGRYDGVAHRHLQTGLDGARARLAGMFAIGLSQTAGFGIITGTFARWRLLPGLSPVRAAQMTALTGVTFMAALAAICGATLILFSPFPYAIPTGFALLLACATACAATFMYPSFSLGKHRYRWPSLHAMAALCFWAVVDVTAAGVALWLLLPPDTGISLATMLPVYFLALGLAIVSSSPGGTGPLELALVSLLASYDATAILAGIFAFRLVYYLAPAALSAVVLIWPTLLGPKARRFQQLDVVGSRKNSPHTIAFSRPRSETAIVRQNGGHLRSFGFNQIAMLDTPQCSVAFFDPVKGYAAETFEPLQQYARDRNTVACYYKCSPRVAVAARHAGWKLLRIAQDAIVDPRSFSESGSSKRQLRRKLRNAEKAGIEVRDAADTLPMSQLARVDRIWHDAHKVAHGTTMGRFEPGYIKAQQVFIAWQNSTIIGFATFHVSAEEWCLDLIRMGPEAPDGTGHALVRAAIASAAEEGIARLSLAAVPDHRFAHRVERGLRRFKSCFAPTWQPLYIAAPSWSDVALSLAELVRLVHRPLPVLPALEWVPSDLRPSAKSEWETDIHKEDEENEIVFARRA